MNKLLVIFFFVFGTLFSTVFGQVDTPDARSSLLQGLRTTLGNSSIEATDYSSLRTPFVLAVEEEEVVEQVSKVATPVARKARLGDSVALGVISEQVKPLGSLIMGSSAVLQLSNGKTIKRGATFSANISGYTYDVLIQDITGKGYTLKLGSAETAKTFITTSGASR